MPTNKTDKWQAVGQITDELRVDLEESQELCANAKTALTLAQRQAAYLEAQALRLIINPSGDGMTEELDGHTDGLTDAAPTLIVSGNDIAKQLNCHIASITLLATEARFAAQAQDELAADNYNKFS